MKIKKKFAMVFFFFALTAFICTFVGEAETWPPAPEFCPKLEGDSPELAQVDYGDYRALRSFWKVFVPDWLGKIIASHIEVMHSAGYFNKLSREDFDHGHLLLRGGGDQAQALHESTDEFFSGVGVILYHTQELTGLWEKEARAGKSAEERTPRSLVGFLNGVVRRASHVVGSDKMQRDWYEAAGTITSFCVADAFNDGLVADGFSLTVVISGKKFMPELEFAIRPFVKGRYVVNGQKFDCFVRFETIEKSRAHQ